MNVAVWVADALGLTRDAVELVKLDIGTATYLEAIYRVERLGTTVIVRGSYPSRTRPTWLLTARLMKPRPGRQWRWLAKTAIDDPNTLAFRWQEGDFAATPRKLNRLMQGPIDDVGDPPAEPDALQELERCLREFEPRDDKYLEELSPEIEQLQSQFVGWGPAYFNASKVGAKRRNSAYARARSLGSWLPSPAKELVRNAAGALVVRDLIDHNEFVELFEPVSLAFGLRSDLLHSGRVSRRNNRQTSDA
jgi:hypothetical protein